jgi:hypothetical protein
MSTALSPIVAAASGGSLNSSKITPTDLADAKKLMDSGAMLLIEGAPLKALRIVDQTQLDSGSFDGSTRTESLLKTSTGLLINRSDVTDTPPASSTSERGGGGFSDSRNFLLMNRAAFQYAVARGKVATPLAERITFIKQDPDSQIVMKNLKTGIDGVYYNGELYTVANASGQEQWKRIFVSDSDGDPWIQS